VPSGRYLSLAHTRHHLLIQQYLALECKTWSGIIYSIDVQYKEAKHLCRYHGKPLFMGTVSVLNEYNEIRTQFHAVSDTHAQYEQPLSAMIDTITAWGQQFPRLMHNDNPTRDCHFLQSKAPSLKREQERIDRLVVNTTCDAYTNVGQQIIYTSISRARYQMISRYEDINTVCDLVRNALAESEQWHVGLDCEWGLI
jgi:hypothetical protein